MPMSPLSSNSGVKYTAVASSRNVAIEPQKNERLDDKVSRISENIKSVKSSLLKLDARLTKENSSLSSLQDISRNNGDNANIRLKEGRFKNGTGSALFSGSRYKNERQAAAENFGLKGSTVTVSNAIKITQEKVNNITAEQNKLKNEINTLEHNKQELINNRSTPTSSSRSSTTSNSSVKSTDSNSSINNNKIVKDFSLVYQSSAGCKAINSEARKQFGNSSAANGLNSSNVVAEYEKSFGSDIFSGGNKDIKGNIKAFFSDVSGKVKAAADELYTPRDTNSRTFRGQGMTEKGFEQLVKQFNENKGQVYKTGQFFSTSKSADIAKDFANESTDNTKVMFEIKGNSANGLKVGNGFSFGYKKTEEERLYSPKANFKINNVYNKNSEGIYKIVLEEVPATRNAKLLPY